MAQTPCLPVAPETPVAISLPEGHDPNSFFVQGGDAQQFQALLEEAHA
jgi:hypothetical protein